MSPSPLVSVVIPTLRPGADLPPLLERLFTQRGVDFEVWVADSGSPAQELEVLRQWPVRRVDIPPGAFGHGRTRQEMAGRARGEVIVFLVQDALPVGDTWLATLTGALLDCPEADGAYARQIPRPEADAVVGERLGVAFPPGGLPQLKRLPPGQRLADLPPLERLTLARYDHVAAAARRQALLERPLRDVPFGEDLRWAIETLLDGRGLLYVPGAVVVHSHTRSPQETFERTRREHAALREWLNLRLVPGRAELALGAAAIGARAARRLGRAPLAEIGGEAARLLAELLGQYEAGARIDNPPGG